MSNPVSDVMSAGVRGGLSLIDGLARTVVVLAVACVLFVPLGIWKAIELASWFLAWFMG